MGQAPLDVPNGVFTSDALIDLHRVATALGAIEIRMSVLSVQMECADSPFGQRTVAVTREIGELHELLTKTLSFDV